MARNVRRINAELGLLQRRQGAERVFWPGDLSWILVRGRDLPPGLNRGATDMLVIVPDGYGYGVPYRELYVDPELRLLRGGRLLEIPHYFDGNGYAPTVDVRRKGWRYLCLHMDGWLRGDNVLTFLKQVEVFLSDPFSPMWERQ